MCNAVQPPCSDNYILYIYTFQESSSFIIHLTFFRMLILTFAAMIDSTTFKWPFSVATINAVAPSCTESRQGEHTIAAHSLSMTNYTL